MNLPFDYHNHPQGHRIIPYTQELLQPWAESARAKGLKEVAFTDHDRYCQGIRIDEISRLQDANPDIVFLAGVELDNDPVTSEAGRVWVEKHWDDLDFVLGSAHYLPSELEMFDQVNRKEEFATRNMPQECEHYLGELEKMIVLGSIDALAHLDLIKIHGVWHPESGLLPYFQKFLERIKQADLAMEISTAGWRKPVGEQYPHVDLIRAALALEIPLTLASDAHSSVQLAEEYPRLAILLKEAGVKKIATYRSHRRTLINLPEN